MAAPENIPLIQHAIQLSITPVFLLSGIGALLGVMTNRLARIIDRARDLEQRWKGLDAAAMVKARVEVADLERRRSCSSGSINLCALAALLVCLVIVTLFVEEFVRVDLKWLAGVQFVAAMISLIGGLSFFLAEVRIATHSSRIDAESFAK